MKHVVLIGMMGCGKTTCGNLLGARLGLPVADTDACVVAQEGQSIPDLFATRGEAYFRTCEGRVAAELAARQEAAVIACGGGLPLREEAFAPLRERGVVFFLNRDPGEIYDRVSMQGRPLAQDGRRAFLALFAQREAAYRRCAHHVITQFSSPEATVAEILQHLPGGG